MNTVLVEQRCPEVHFHVLKLIPAPQFTEGFQVLSSFIIKIENNVLITSVVVLFLPLAPPTCKEFNKSENIWAKAARFRKIIYIL